MGRWIECLLFYCIIGGLRVLSQRHTYKLFCVDLNPGRSNTEIYCAAEHGTLYLQMKSVTWKADTLIVMNALYYLIWVWDIKTHHGFLLCFKCKIASNNCQLIFEKPLMLAKAAV